jgi:hypothetical protein
MVTVRFDDGELALDVVAKRIRDVGQVRDLLLVELAGPAFEHGDAFKVANDVRGLGWIDHQPDFAGRTLEPAVHGVDARAFSRGWTALTLNDSRSPNVGFNSLAISSQSLPSTFAEPREPPVASP